MNEAQNEQIKLNSSVIEVLTNNTTSLASINCIIDALLFVLYGKDPSLKAELVSVVSGLVEYLDREGEDSTAQRRALEKISGLN